MRIHIPNTSHPERILNRYELSSRLSDFVYGATVSVPATGVAIIGADLITAGVCGIPLGTATIAMGGTVLGGFAAVNACLHGTTSMMFGQNSRQVPLVHNIQVNDVPTIITQDYSNIQNSVNNGKQAQLLGQYSISVDHNTGVISSYPKPSRAPKPQFGSGKTLQPSRSR